MLLVGGRSATSGALEAGAKEKKQRGERQENPTGSGGSH